MNESTGRHEIPPTSHGVESLGPVGQFLKCFFEALEASGIGWCVLRKYEGLPERPGGDVDLLVTKGAFGGVAEVVHQVAQKQGWRLHGTGSHANVSRSYLLHKYDETAGLATLKLEVRTRVLVIVGHRRRPLEVTYLPTDRVLSRTRLMGGLVRVLDEVDEGVHLLVESTLVGKKDYWEKLFSLWVRNRERFGRRLGGTCAPELAAALGEGLDRQDTEELRRLSGPLCGALVAQFKPTAVERLAHDVSAAWQIARGLARPGGQLVVLLGPDGVGKTTTADLVAERLVRVVPNGVQRRHLGMRPAMLPSNTRKKEEHGGSEGTKVAGEDTPRWIPGKGSPVWKGNVVYGSGRVLYHALDYFIEGITRLRWHRSRGALILSERYAYDYVAAPDRHNPAAHSSARRVALRLVPKPDLVLVLDADPTVVIGRKAELTLAQAEAHREAYRQIASRTRTRCLILDAGRPMDEVVADVCVAILRLYATQNA